ncbi:hypothetical protein D3C76_1263990 [compost metagenome]
MTLIPLLSCVIPTTSAYSLYLSYAPVLPLSINLNISPTIGISAAYDGYAVPKIPVPPITKQTKAATTILFFLNTLFLFMEFFKYFFTLIFSISDTSINSISSSSISTSFNTS